MFTNKQRKKKTTTSKRLLRRPLICKLFQSQVHSVWPRFSSGDKGGRVLQYILIRNKILPPLKIHSELPSSTPPPKSSGTPAEAVGRRGGSLYWSPWEKLLPTWQRWMAAPQEGRRHKHVGFLWGLGPESPQTIIKQHESERLWLHIKTEGMDWFLIPS